jgi:hypothetical protein
MVVLVLVREIPGCAQSRLFVPLKNGYAQDDAPLGHQQVGGYFLRTSSCAGGATECTSGS